MSSQEEFVGRYKQDVLIGKGSYGDVYSGTDTHTGKRIALKVIDLEEVEDDIDEVRYEVLALADCCCSQITEYYNSELVPNSSKLLIAMELMACSAADLLEAAPLDEASIAYALRQMVHALVYLHSKRRMHRDIKAANVLLTGGAVVKISDFGVSGQLSSTLGFKRKTFVGTPYWMAPEVIESSEEGYTTAADIWSLGITAIEMATQRPPHSDLHPMKVLFMIPKADSPVLSGPFSPELQDFVAQCVRKEPSQRLQAHELVSHPFIAQATEPPAALLKRVSELLERREQAVVARKSAAKSMGGDGTVRLSAPPTMSPAWDFQTTGREERQPASGSLRSRPVNTDTFRAAYAGTFRSGHSSQPGVEDWSDATVKTTRAVLASAAVAARLEDGERWDDGRATRPGRVRLADLPGDSDVAAPRPAEVPKAAVLREILAPCLKRAAEHASPPAAGPQAAAAAENVLQALSQLEAVCPGSCVDLLTQTLAVISSPPSQAAPDVHELHAVGCKMFESAGPTAQDTSRVESPMRQFLVKRWQSSAKRELLNASRLFLHA